jgi:hypothetical protein
VKLIAALGALASLVPAAALAQRPPEPAPAPHGIAAAASTPTPALRYQSAFESYRAWRDEPMESWRDVNDRVGRVGGHAGVLKAESGEAPAQPSQPPGKPAHSPAGGGHRHAH